MFFKQLKADLAKMHKSLTIWFNGLITLAAIALPFAQDNFPALQEYIDPALYKEAMFVILVGNMVLRFKTRCALADK